MPAGSTYAAIIRDVLAWHREDPATGARTWQRIQDKWDKEDSCPDGSLRPFNIDARLNGAYIALGLLYGNGDFARRWTSRHAPARTPTATRPTRPAFWA